MHDGTSCSVLFGLLLLIIGTAARAETITVRFDEITAYAELHSPRSKTIDRELDRMQVERDEELQWSNPTLGYSREDVVTSEEYQVTIGKDFEMPWLYYGKRESWDDRITAAGLSGKQEIRLHLADLRKGYVKLRLLSGYLERLGELRAVIDEVSSVAASKRTEGYLSGTDEHLIQMSLISLDAGHQGAMQKYRETLARWRAAMGIPFTNEVVLVTDIPYREVELESEAHYIGLMESQPGLKARITLREALSRRAAAERFGLVPSVSLYGGYKKLLPDYEGYVAGVSLSIPVFDRNGTVSRRYEIESDIAAYEAQQYRNQQVGHIRALVASLTESRASLGSAADHVNEGRGVLTDIFEAYEEGWLTLNELLNAVQIEVAGLRDYYDRLIRYYADLFELEALTGESLVTFK